MVADFGFADLIFVAPGLDFGRDTLLALRLLLPIMTPTASEAVLGAVLERINSTGAVCHEETVSRFVNKFRVGQRLIRRMASSSRSVTMRLM